MIVSTYRLQLHAGFTLADARETASYLTALGVTDCYLSPIFMASPGSTHGYDVCRHAEFNPELGGEPAFEAFADTTSALGMGIVVDFVPNHMSNDPHTNDWWRDVLENGPSSPFATFFDIDWDPVKPELKDRLLLAILGEQYGDALERGALQLAIVGGALMLHYGDQSIPINPRRSPMVFSHGIEALEQELGADHPDLREFLSILTALRNLPPYVERDPDKSVERQREKTVARERLNRLIESSAPVRAHVGRSLAVFNGVPGDAASFDPLHALLEAQVYRLASWRTAADEINYRRFFDVNALAGLRVEDPAVFDHIHTLLLRLVADGRVSAVRLDHIDGLFDPQAYLTRLDTALDAAIASGGAAGERRGRPAVIVEKILSHGEALRPDWTASGTTGYTFMNDVNGLFVDGRNARRMQRVYARLTGRQDTFADVAYESKRLIVSTALSSEFQVLTRAVNRISEGDRRVRDFTLASIRRALREVVACFPMYRTYVTAAGATAADAAAVDAAIADARRRNPASESSIFDFLRAVLLPGAASPQGPSLRHEVAMRFQQYTAPVQAKGIEDTAFYRYHLLTSLNEVGGDPARFGREIHEFHAANAARRLHRPGDMLATTTHDTKRSEDGRARINVLSEVPDLWAAAVSRWRRVNAPNRTRVGGAWAPDANDEYLFYQALVGAWPPPAGEAVDGAVPQELVARLRGYMHKAIKEAKLHTSWITPNAEYEAAVQGFIERSLTGRTSAAFLASFLPFLGSVATAGMVNSLAQLLLKLTAPGVTDVYQGTELWDHSLVDPDNRRPVDFGRRRQLLRELEPWLTAAETGAEPAGGAAAAFVATLLEHWPDARIKMFITALGLRLRRAHASLFLEGEYLPLGVRGPGARHLVAYARRRGTRAVVVVAPRLTIALCGQARLPVGGAVWGETSLVLPAWASGAGCRDLITNTRHEVPAGRPALEAGAVLDVCPVALLWMDLPETVRV